MERNLTGLAIYVLESARAMGVTVPPSSRLGRMQRAVEPGFNIAPDHPDFQLALESLRDLQQLAFVFDELSQPHAPADFARRLRKVIEDAALPQENLTKSQGRDA